MDTQQQTKRVRRSSVRNGLKIRVYSVRLRAWAHTAGQQPDLTAAEKAAVSGLTEADIARFEAHVDRSGGPDACHPWTGQVKASRNPRLLYGVLYVGRRKVKAHRIACAIGARRPLRKDEVARHGEGCTTTCCNEAHLRPGTQLQNVADRELREGHWNRYFAARVAAGFGVRAARGLSRTIGRIARSVARGLLSLDDAFALSDAATLQALAGGAP